MLTPTELRELIEEVQHLHSELDDVEVKTAQGGTPQRLFEVLSAFANRPGGGLLLLGLDERRAFQVVGVGDAHRIQEEISHLAAADMEPPLRPDFMRAANLEPPRFQDRRTSFLLTFRNHALMNPEAIVWLNQFAGHPLNDRHRLALVYLRANEQMANRDYQRLNRVDSVTANRELRKLVESGLTAQHSTRRWAYYTLSAPAETPVVPTEEEMVLRYVQEHGSIGNAECRDLLKTELHRASYLLKKMHKVGLLSRQGERRWTRYFLS